MALPTITLAGNLTRDPELRFTGSGKAVVNFSVACNQRHKNEAGEWVDGETTYLDVTSWYAPEQINTDLHKGSKVLVTGTLKQRSYETKDGEKRTSFEVNADTVAIIVKPQAGAPATQTIAAADPWTGTDNTTTF